MKKLLLGLGSITIVATPALVVAASYINLSDSTKNLNEKLSYFYEGKIYDSKNEIYRDYLLSHPDLINQKRVIGDIDKSVIDFDSEMLNISDLPDFDPSKIDPVYVRADGGYEKDFETAKSSQVNPALTTNDYTDSFGNFFKSKDAAKTSYKWKVLDGKIATNNVPTIGGNNIDLNPLSEDDKRYFKNDTLSYFQQNGSLTNNYSRKYFKNDEEITNFYDIFDSQNSLESVNNSTVSRYELMQAKNNNDSSIGVEAKLVGMEDKNLHNSSNPLIDDINDLSNPSVTLNTETKLRSFARSATVTNFNEDVNDYRTSLLNQIEDNKKANDDFDLKHKDVDSDESIDFHGKRVMTINRYRFTGIEIEKKGLTNDKDDRYNSNHIYSGDLIKYNGVYQDHRAPYYQRYVGWDGAANNYFKSYYFNLRFYDSIKNKYETLKIWVNGGKDDNVPREDYASYSIVDNKLFGYYVPGWGGYDVFDQIDHGINTRATHNDYYSQQNGRSFYPWIIGNIHLSEAGSFGSILDGFSVSPTIAPGTNYNGFYNGEWTSKTISSYKDYVLKFLNNKASEKDFSTKAKEIYMSKYEIDELKKNNSYSSGSTSNQITELSEYITLNSVWNGIEYSRIYVENTQGVDKLKASYDEQNIIVNGYSYRLSSGSFSLPIKSKFDSNNKPIDWLGTNVELQKKYLSLSEISNPFSSSSPFYSSSFNPSKSILNDNSNNKIYLTYNKYKELLKSNTTNKMNIDVVSKEGYHFPYVIDLGELLRENPDFARFSTLLDNPNILDNERNSAKVIINFENIDFMVSSNKLFLSGINFEWVVYANYHFSEAPVSLSMNTINNSSMEKNSLLWTLQKLLDRPSEYLLSNDDIEQLENAIKDVGENVAEKILIDDLPIFEVVRDNSIVSRNNITDLEYLDNDFKIEDLFLAIKDPIDIDKLIKAYNNGYLEEFKALLKRTELFDYPDLDALTNKEQISYAYLYTLKKYILTSSIVGNLPNKTHFKLPELNGTLWNIGTLSLKRYLVHSQYVFNGSLLTSEMNSIGKENLFDPSEMQAFNDFRDRIIESFNPPRVTQLYDLNGREFSIDDSGSLLYDNETTVIENSRLKAYPERLIGMVFYDGIPNPILNKVSMIYYVKIESQLYYFKDYNSIYNFIKEYIDEFILTTEGGN